MDAGNLQEENQTLSRRRFSTGLCLGMLSVLASCGGGVDEPAPMAATAASGTAQTTTWDVVPNRALALAPGATFDLADTLPASVARGGVFEVDASGAPLPTGITLQPTGRLLVGEAASGAASGLVFRYTPPA